MAAGVMCLGTCAALARFPDEVVAHVQRELRQADTRRLLRQGRQKLLVENAPVPPNLFSVMACQYGLTITTITTIVLRITITIIAIIMIIVIIIARAAGAAPG